MQPINHAMETEVEMTAEVEVTNEEIQTKVGARERKDKAKAAVLHANNSLVKKKALLIR